MNNGAIVQAGNVPALSLTQQADRYNQIVEVVKSDLMKQGVDFGSIPGTGKVKVEGKWVEKMVLLKPGAEKLCTFFGLSSTMELVSSFEDWTGEKSGGIPLFAYAYKCTLWRGDVKVAECVGACNSKEKKYRYRWEGSDNNRKQVENTEPYDQINTLHKMAQKRAYVGATLIAVNASEFFTQDLEEIEVERQEPQRRSWVETFFATAVEELGYPTVDIVKETLGRLKYGNQPGQERITKENRYIVLGELQAYAIQQKETSRRAAEPVTIDGETRQQQPEGVGG